MNTTLLTLAGIFVILYGVPAIYSALVGRSTHRIELTSLPHRYRASGLFFLVAAGNFVMVAGIFCLGFFPKPVDPGFRLFFFGLGAIFLVIACGATWQLCSAYVIVDSETVEFKFGRAVKRVRRSDIKKVYTANGCIVIDTGTIPRVAIPMLFSDSRQLFSLLKSG